MLILVIGFLFSAPYPSTSSSAVVSNNSTFYSKWGFDILSSDIHWTKFLPNKEEPYHLVTYRPIQSAPDSQASLNIRVDPVKKRVGKTKIVLKSYLKYWLKQYPKLGLEVLSQKYTVFNGKKAAVVDAYNIETKKQLRQYIVWEKDNAILFSCSDKKADFPISLYACEQILQSIAWKD